MARGGKRPNAGRKNGSVNRATKENKATLSDLARRHSAIALKALADVAKKGTDSARVAAAVALLDRGYGRPVQSLEHSGPQGGPIPTLALDPEKLAGMTDAELAALETAIGKLQRGDGAGAGGAPFEGDENDYAAAIGDAAGSVAA
jgi:hypothetical protein